VTQALHAWQRSLIDRRAFLLRVAGGSLAALFGLPAAARAGMETAVSRSAEHTWETLDQVQQQLFPSEPEAPGAREINALDYLRFVVDDPKVDAEERSFILLGAGWLDGIARETYRHDFIGLNPTQQEAVLQKIAASPAGENWLSTLITYLLEALLTDPVYGGNPEGIGWRWLQHIPGYPRPTPDKTYPRLLS
jgi:gluconate 2-dehydrogenase gamma chain